MDPITEEYTADAFVHYAAHGFLRPKHPRHGNHIEIISVSRKELEKHLLEHYQEMQRNFEIQLAERTMEYNKQIQYKNDEIRNLSHEWATNLEKVKEDRNAETQRVVRLERKLQQLQSNFNVIHTQRLEAQEEVSGYQSRLKNLKDRLHKAIMQQDTLHRQLVEAHKVIETNIKNLAKSEQVLKETKVELKSVMYKGYSHYRLKSHLLSSENSKLKGENQELLSEISTSKAILVEQTLANTEIRVLVSKLQDNLVELEVNQTQMTRKRSMGLERSRIHPKDYCRFFHRMLERIGQSSMRSSQILTFLLN
ncbi:hypothetical protein PGT21_019854 [Puccinia graminis f. sp. tritici]|uniref:Uncharacterized protein n=1 Tax=Puccinia graminis f. sp. tritici TaxID=56615 RepID=A0A5B0NEN4_PUCGR|nr:hypothetical protein PGT21_019854 [Puccinia graminis f. sp. tritici]